MHDTSQRARRLDTIVNLRMTDEELTELERLRERLQQDAPIGHKSTRREVIMAGIAMLAAKYAKLDADRERKR